MAAGLAQIVRQLELTAVRALLKRRGLQRMVAAAHVALGGRGFSFRNGHRGTCLESITKKLATIGASSTGKPRGGGRIVANAAPIAKSRASARRPGPYGCPD